MHSFRRPNITSPSSSACCKLNHNSNSVLILMGVWVVPTHIAAVQVGVDGTVCNKNQIYSFQTGKTPALSVIATEGMSMDIMVIQWY